MKTAFPSMIRTVASVALLWTFVATGFAQSLPERSLEMVGVVSVVHPATSSVTIDGKTLLITPHTLVTSADPTIDTQISIKWVGRDVAYEWAEKDDAALLSDLHFLAAQR